MLKESLNKEREKFVSTEKSLTEYPGLAKFGIALDLGSRDRGFKSRSPDQNPASFHYENWRGFLNQNLLFSLTVGSLQGSFAWEIPRFY